MFAFLLFALYQLWQIYATLKAASVLAPRELRYVDHAFQALICLLRRLFLIWYLARCLFFGTWWNECQRLHSTGWSGEWYSTWWTQVLVSSISCKVHSQHFSVAHHNGSYGVGKRCPCSSGYSLFFNISNGVSSWRTCRAICSSKVPYQQFRRL